jgi:hypothetical protein
MRASFEGARREQLRRWAQLPLETILVALEEMRDIAHQLGPAPEDMRQLKFLLEKPDEQV